MRKILAIAGSDCSGGAGIQADLKTITSHKMYGMSVITALTAQNTTGVFGVMESTPDFAAKQLDAVFSDIYPDAVKIGMVSSKTLIEVISEKLAEYKAKNIVLDPVMISTSGSKLLNDDAIETLKYKLMPLADIITPNIPEAECLSGIKIKNKQDMEEAALKISKNFPGHILIKGGHLEDSSDDLLFHDGMFSWYNHEKIKNTNTHGTGCTLSSAIACSMADGFTVAESIFNAKNYLTGALNYNLNLGKGRGPLNHCWNI
ncbi:MAG: bifunctional hydroxymethylpyrimidine kinase/phosphomethylpyrimidine kinase [Sedimentibacter saalensis]|uniref:bifunctional hydroxymethylpyrimidine kinase/phosphomethylpyrimidine kinase n=1 Tax=Sedimentibacter saalensis TaxID=130788 RepID=UPI002B2139FD|nr:bifunctional hydroxymethylpyrimidine kinase/phosphomethylpyrimidine kinase [Sedimentibacter saalensis]MEA5096449.1 bifunctional hydroxymethylpyrimidine kinase/phosphomethylpyrimidine kinase [Sedimentibacter saalensis]